MERVWAPAAIEVVLFMIKFNGNNTTFKKRT